MSNATSVRDGAGRGAAMAVWALYLLSIPSSGLLALVGLIVAYASRGEASAWTRTHFEAQIQIWWVAALWAIGLAVLSVIAWMLTIVLIGFPLLWLLAAIGLVVAIWFTIRSAIGLVRLMNGQDA